jgi:hypothetical protein
MRKNKLGFCMTEEGFSLTNKSSGEGSGAE